MHLRRRALEQTATTGREQGVAAEQLLVRVIGDVPKGMSRHREHLKGLSKNREPITVSKLMRQLRDSGEFRLRTIDGNRATLQKRVNAADVVRMPVRNQDRRQF